MTLVGTASLCEVVSLLLTLTVHLGRWSIGPVEFGRWIVALIYE